MRSLMRAGDEVPRFLELLLKFDIRALFVFFGVREVLYAFSTGCPVCPA